MQITLILAYCVMHFEYIYDCASNQRILIIYQILSSFDRVEGGGGVVKTLSYSIFIKVSQNLTKRDNSSKFFGCN